MHSTATTTENYLVQTVSRAEVDKPCSRPGDPPMYQMDSVPGAHVPEEWTNKEQVNVYRCLLVLHAKEKNKVGQEKGE